MSNLHKKLKSADHIDSYNYLQLVQRSRTNRAQSHREKHWKIAQLNKDQMKLSKVTGYLFHP